MDVELLDAQDLEILSVLQEDGRISNARLAARVGLSEAACWRRFKRLESEGYIVGFQANLDRRKLGIGVVAFVLVRLANHRGEEASSFEREVQGVPEVLGCHNITGQADYLLHVVARDLDAYGELVHNRLRQLPGVASLTSSLMLRRVKFSRRLPLEQLARGS